MLFFFALVPCLPMGTMKSFGAPTQRPIFKDKLSTLPILSDFLQLGVAASKLLSLKTSMQWNCVNLKPT